MALFAACMKDGSHDSISCAHDQFLIWESITLAAQNGDESDGGDISSGTEESVELEPEVMQLAPNPARDTSPSNVDTIFEEVVMPIFYIRKNGFNTGAPRTTRIVHTNMVEMTYHF